MKRLTSIVMVSFVVSFPPALFAGEKDSLFNQIDITGIVETEWVIQTNNSESQKFETTFMPEFNLEVTNDISLASIVRIRADAEDRLEPGKPSNDSRSDLNQRVFIDNYLELELREFFVDTYWGDTFLRLGKQQVVWGQADGLKVLDVVNPQSYREFILDEFDDSRIPLWTVNAEMPIGEDIYLQILWVPDQTYHDIPDRDAVYSFTSSRLIPKVPEGIDVNINPVNRPSNLIMDSDVGMRLSAFYGGWDITLNYLYHYHDSPILYRSVNRGVVDINPTLERTHLIGGTLSNAFGDFTLRSEIGYSTNNYFITEEINDANGIAEAGDFSYVVGLDYSGISDTFLSVQIFQSILKDNLKGVARDKVENTVTFLAERSFANEAWETEILFIYSIKDEDGIIRPKVKYEFASSLNIWVGVDIFYGNRDGVYGQFDENDRFYLGFEWGF